MLLRFPPFRFRVDDFLLVFCRCASVISVFRLGKFIMKLKPNHVVLCSEHVHTTIQQYNDELANELFRFLFCVSAFFSLFFSYCWFIPFVMVALFFSELEFVSIESGLPTIITVVAVVVEQQIHLFFYFVGSLFFSALFLNTCIVYRSKNKINSEKVPQRTSLCSSVNVSYSGSLFCAICSLFVL